MAYKTLYFRTAPTMHAPLGHSCVLRAYYSFSLSFGLVTSYSGASLGIIPGKLFLIDCPLPHSLLGQLTSHLSTCLPLCTLEAVYRLLLYVDQKIP